MEGEIKKIIDGGSGAVLKKKKKKIFMRDSTNIYIEPLKTSGIFYTNIEEGRHLTQRWQK